MNPKSPLRRTEPNHAKYETETLDISTKGPGSQRETQALFLSLPNIRFIVYPSKFPF
jgi:hypothetical protein